MKREINVIKGPLFEKNKQAAQRYLAEIIKRELQQGKIPIKSIS